MIRGKLSSKLPALGSQRCSLQFRATLAPQEALKVKIPALACAVMWLFVLPEVTKAQDLGDLRHILIVIEELNKETRNLGLTEQSLSDMVLVALKRDIPKLKIDNALQGSYCILFFVLCIVLKAGFIKIGQSQS